MTDAVLEEVTQWQQRPLEPLYPVVLFDCLRVKIRDEGVVRNKAVYVALGVERAGRKDVLGRPEHHGEVDPRPARLDRGALIYFAQLFGDRLTPET